MIIVVKVIFVAAVIAVTSTPATITAIALFWLALSFALFFWFSLLLLFVDDWCDKDFAFFRHSLWTERYFRTNGKLVYSALLYFTHSSLFFRTLPYPSLLHPTILHLTLSDPNLPYVILLYPTLPFLTLSYLTQPN